MKMLIFYISETKENPFIHTKIVFVIISYGHISSLQIVYLTLDKSIHVFLVE